MFNTVFPNSIEYERIIKGKGKEDDELHRAYCVCKKVRPTFSGIYIGKSIFTIECSGRNCPYGNWMHSDCVGLEFVFEKELDLLGKYYCSNCLKKEKK